jgi:DNA-directed RNA polymerase beta' subunit/intein/homing endonuclease
MALLLKQNPSKIVGVQFSTFSPEEIRRYSVAEITNRNTYAGKKPVLGGLFTPQCGGGDITGSTKQICPTDGLTSTESPGYFAHLELATTLFSMHHIKNILKVRKSTCFACSRLLFSKSQHQHMLEMSPQERTEYAYNLCKKIRRCGVQNEDGCGCKQPDKYELKSIASLFAVWEKVAIVTPDGNKENVKKIVRLYPEMVLKQFKRITDEDMVFLGYHPVWSKPEWFLLTVLPVAPPAVRPSVKPDAQQRSEDDLTHIYSHIVRTNQDLRAAIQENKAEHVVENLRLILQFLVASLVSNKIKGASPMTQRSGRPLQNICSRLNTKHGRIRGNLMGKRVNFSARSVITGDPNLSIRLLGVPLNIAKNITKPVIVNDRNRDFLTHLVQNGPSTYPGAKILERKGFGQTSGGGNQISLRYVDRTTIRLENGDIVHRHLMDGDFVLFNRQPSLHRMSMMAHEVRVMKYGDTFRFNVGDTPPYNADFDGDEMNMHAPQSVQAETELQYLPAIPWQIISPAKNSPVIGIFQDSLLGSYYFTRPHVRLSMLHAMELLAQYTKVQPQLLIQMAKKINSRGKNHGEEHTVSSFDILTQIFPPMTSVNKTTLFVEDKDVFPTSNNVVEIQNGHYLRGQLEKSMFASTSKGILHRICNDFGNRTCADFIDDIQNIINEYMKSSSFSVGISDLIANKTTQREITRVIESQKQEVQLLIEKVHLGIFENKTANSNAAEFELQVNNMLNKALEDAGKIGRNSLGKNNRFVMIVNSGSKGGPQNISQMISCFGQQNIDGKRIPNGFDNRPLPHFCKYDDSPKARGFIENSYITGLTAVEVFYHAMGGRIGLIDTAVKSVTWETPIIIIENQKPRYTEIGKWIDAQLDASPEKVEHHTERQLELMNITEVYIPTTNEHGEITWGEVTAITRHDPGDQLYEIKTTGGRSVIVTESKSLLIWNPETKEFREMLTPDIRVGDCVPVTAELAEPPVVLECISETCSLFGFENNGKLTLNEENGIFIGICLSEDASIYIENSKSFTNHWFSKHSIERTGKNYIQLHDYLVKILGKEASEKHVPEEAYLAPESFIKGLLNGYFSENGIITEDSIEAVSDSKRLVEDVNMLCSRLGIFGEISQTETEQYRISIRAQWGKKFTEKIQLIEDSKQTKIQAIQWRTFHSNFDTYNNVVLDKIVEINLVDVKDHPKVYDLTIPSTLNFGLANGLQVRDTATTGYIQRRWVKAMEDLVVRYDMTVRNNMGKIIQFKYGDDGFDPVKVERQNLPLLNSSIEDIFSHYDIIGVNDRTQDELSIYTKGARSRMQSQRDEARVLCRKYIDKMIETRDHMVEKVFRGRDDNRNINVPVMFKSIIDNLQGQLGLGKMTEYSSTAKSLLPKTQNSTEDQESLTTVTDITPLEAFQIIEDYYKNRLETLGNAGPNKMFETLYYYYLTPKTLLVEKRFHRKALEQLLETVVQRYKQAIVHPGEAVGIIAGQSAGELSTQASLNSFHTAAGKQKKSNMTTGVPRIEELLQLTKTPKTPSLTVFMKPIDENNADRAKAVSLMIEYTKLSEIVKGVRILFDPQDDTIVEDRQIIRRYELFEEMIQECNQDGSIVPKTEICNSTHYPQEDEPESMAENEAPLFPNTGKRGKKTNKSDAPENRENSKWVVRLEMDAETMLDKNITMDDISFILNQHYDKQIVCVYSDYNDSQLIFRIRLTTMSAALKEAKNKKILDKSDEVYILKQFMNNLLENTVLRGIPGIVNVMQREMVDTVFKEDGKYTKKNTWVIDTTGSNLQEVLGLDFIDTSRTYSNNVREVAEVLGMEAAVQVLSLEMGEVLPDINNHHLSIIVDKMTSLKNMCPVFRTGIFADNVGPLMKSSFEMHSEVLLNAARHGEFDNARGISASVMLGQAGYFGTSSFQVLLDMKEMEKLKESKAILEKDRNQALAEGFGDLSKEATEDYCSKAQVSIANHLSLIQAQDHGDNCIDDYDMGF